MITRTAYRLAHVRANELLRASGLALRDEELAYTEVVDFGLSELELTGAQILALVNTREIAVKLIALFAGQTLPQHRHPPLGDYPGKVETLRCERGELYLYLEGERVVTPRAQLPTHRLASYTVWREVILRPGEQVTVPSNTWHWFQGGPDGSVVWSYSSRATDVQDIFNDPDIHRVTVIVEDS